MRPVFAFYTIANTGKVFPSLSEGNSLCPPWMSTTLSPFSLVPAHPGGHFLWVLPDSPFAVTSPKHLYNHATIVVATIGQNLGHKARVCQRSMPVESKMFISLYKLVMPEREVAVCFADESSASFFSWHHMV